MNNIIIETKDITKSYGEQLAVNKLNIHIRKGEIYSLIGRNGAGKTTLMKILIGLTTQTSGEVNIFGENPNRNRQLINERIGCMIETPSFYPNLTGTENLNLFGKLRGLTHKEAVKTTLDIVGLPYNDKKLFSEYSLGMKQRLGIANAIMHDPELLILDEPTNGLDPVGISEMREFLVTLCKERGKTILISSHILSEISLLTDSVGIIHSGVLLEECSYKELELKSRKYTILKVSSAPKACNILDEKLKIKDYIVENNETIRIYNLDMDPTILNKELTLAGVGVSGISPCSDTLEDYFKKLTGGVGIA